MKRYLLTIVCLLMGFALKSQSVYTCQYWFDEDDGQAVTTTFGGDIWQAAIDVGSLPDGVHTLHFHVADTSMNWSSPQSFLFIKLIPIPEVSDVVCHYWFDHDAAAMQSYPLGNGMFPLNVDGLADGIHTLHVMIEGNDFASTQSFLFIKLTPELPITQVQYHYWFDWDEANMQSGTYGNGLMQLDVNDLEEGVHTLHVMMEGNEYGATQSFLFFKKDMEAPSAELTYFYWFDDNNANIWNGTLGDGILPMDVNGLEEGEHVLNIVIEGNNMTATQSFEFTKLLPSPCPYPDNLEAVLNDTSFVSFTWTCPGDNFRFKYYTSDDPTPIIDDVTSHSYVLNSPAPSTYYWSVQSVCSEVDTGYYVSGPSILVPNMFSITAIAYPEVAGIVTGGGLYEENSEATVSAMPDEGYMFLRWTESGEIVSEEADYTFTVTSSRELVAELGRPITDTTATACDEFAWHGHTYTDQGVYYDTLTSYLGIDSIVALHLTLYPAYHFEFTEWDCTEYFWEDSLYTESGDYYREYLTIHGCDSTLTMHLSIAPVQIGTFTSMMPTHGFQFSSLPITFSWDVVSEAQYYDLYIWYADEQMPDVPFVANLTSHNYSTIALPNNNSYKWCVKARNACNETMSTERSFVISITPSLTVNTTNINYGEVSMNQSTTYSVGITGVVLEDELQVEITGEDADMFSFVQASGWHNYNGGILLVTFTPTEPRYSYNANLVITSGGLTATTALTGSLTNILSFTTSVPEEIYSMNTPIPITGTVHDWNNVPVGDVEVEINVFVMGMKRTLQAVSDANGQFSVMFEPMAGESGYYTVNSGKAGITGDEIHDSFNIPGISIVNTNQMIKTVTREVPATDSILVKNKSDLPVHDITLSTIQAPPGCVITSSHTLNLGGLEEGYLYFTITGSEVTTGNNYQEVRLSVSGSSAGSTTNTSFNMWYYCIEQRGALDVSPKYITTTMTKGSSKIVDVMVTNNGTGPTGMISLSLPNFEWMSLVGNDTMSSLAVHDTAYFSLRLSPSQDVALVPYSGIIGINSERGDNVAVNYNITAVSDSTGNFVIDVTDDYTYNGDGRHLEGAYVTVRGYYSLETVAAGYTDSTGVFNVANLPEGYYRVKVSAERHAEYNNIIEIMAGETNSMQIFMQYQAISYAWNVVPTEIEDEYTFDLDAEFETNVPVPVITLDYYGIHPLEYGESADFTLVVTNHGLINALETHLTFLDTDEYVFVPLFDIIDTVPAQTTIMVPGTYSRLETRNRVSRGSCFPGIHSESLYMCGNDGHWVCVYSAMTELTNGFCFGDPFQIFSGLDSGGGVPMFNGGGGFIPGSSGGISSGGGSGFIFGESSGSGTPPQTQQESCEPCIEALVNVLMDCLGGTPGCLVRAKNAEDIAICGAEAVIDNIPVVGTIYGILSCVSSVVEHIGNCIRVEIVTDGDGEENKNSKGTMDNLQTTIDNLYYTNFYSQERVREFISYFTDEEWMTEENFPEFFNQFSELLDTTNMISQTNAEALASSFVGTSIDSTVIMHFIDRWNRTQEYRSFGYFTIEDLPVGYDTNFVQVDTTVLNKLTAIENYYESEGYADLEEVYDEAVDNGIAIMERAGQSSVCASVKVRFSQKLTMTREAFEGTFTVHNGHDSKPIENVEVTFKILDDEGHNCTSLFQINPIAFNKLTQIDGSGILDAGLDGSAIIQFIPTKNAAPTIPKNYFFGGTFSFTDPFTDENITYDLYPVEITVNPSPDLYVDYFMQRDILGDDALTEDVVEPSVPAELGVIIHNQGAGMAKNVMLETAEPQIIDNEKGLAIDFAMYGASFNGSPRQLGLMGISFGNIGSGQTAVGEWLFTSSLLGHFVSYDAHVIHNSSYGNPDLSLVSHLDIHELIHPIYAYGNLDDGINDFLVNDNSDAYDTPDSIYFSHGGKTSVGVVDGISYDHYVSPSDTIVTLTVEPSRIGWNYGVTDDPGMNQYDIVSCIRNSDNQVIPLNNVWLTFVTIPDGGDPVYENKLHIVDTLAIQQTTTYTLVFAKKPSNLRIFHGNEDEYWSNAANWEGNIIPQADDEVLIDGICQLDQDAEVFSLTVAENQSLTIPEDRILTVSGQLTSASVSRLIIEEGGQLFHGNTGVQATVQKTIMPYTEGENDGWYFIASPLASVTPVTSVANMLDNEYDLYYYNEPTAYWMNQEYAPNGFSELVNGKGYLYANSEEVLLGFAGELQSGSSTITVFLNYTEGGELQGFNLVGNPFVYNLNSYASVNVANGCYQLNEAKDDLIVSEIDEENPLKPAEGFFVKATDVGASITFNPGRSEMANRNGSIRVELLDNGKLIDRLIVKMDGEPLEKMSLKEQRTKLFAMQNHQEIAIVPCEGNEQPVNFKAAKNGTYTINVNVNDMEFNYLHLIDNLTGADVDLLPLCKEGRGDSNTQASYIFTAKTTDYASRFRLVFSVCEDADGDDVPFAFINNGNIIIIGAEADAVLQIVDVLGHVIVSTDVARNISTGGMAKGMYILRLIEGEKVRTQKIVID